MVVFLYPAGQTISTVAALEYLQPVGAFSPVLGAHLTFFEDRFTDLGPEVSGTTQPRGTVRRSETDGTFLPWKAADSRKSARSLLSLCYFLKKVPRTLRTGGQRINVKLLYLWYDTVWKTA